MKAYPNNQEIAKKLREVAAAYLLKGENHFRIIAYERAADAIEHLTVECKDLWQQGKLKSIPGVGSNIASHLDELFRMGKVKHFRKIVGDIPPALFPLLDIPGFGPMKGYRLVQELGLKNPQTVIGDLEHAAKSGRVAQIEGFGRKSELDILQRIAEYRQGTAKTSRMLLPYAYELVEQLLPYVKKCPQATRIEPLGSLRRMTATVGDIDIAAATDNPKAVIDWFASYPRKERVLEKGATTASILVAGGKHIDIMVQPIGQFGSLLQHFTGSKQHNIRLREYALKKGLSLSEYGIRSQKRKRLRKFATEEDFYRALDMDWIPPELREDQGEIEAALKRQLPKLVMLEDIKGDLHIHSNYNLEPSHDLGSSTPKDILLLADKLGYEYVGFSDHNPSRSRHTEDQIISIMKKRKEYFEKIIYSTKSVRVNLFIMLEVDILPDGTLALPEKAFNYVDAVIISVHSRFNQLKTEMTKRVLTALAHPKVKILGHPTGRMIGRREGFELNWEKVFAFCKKHKKALEINSWPQRLDLPDTLVKQAVDAGVNLVINTDSHQKEQMRNMRYGVAVARRGWASKGDILNTLSYNEFKKWLVE